MALNVEQITSRLAQMPDAALQKYAAMNKNDPYIMALAVSESNRRKQLRQSAQAQQGQAPQPKVVDAAVQSMAQPMPEDMGIARLPAGDMNFADGGIVAFADGGEVERYQVGGMPPLSAGTEFGVEGMTTGNLYQQAIAKAQQGKPLSDVEKALLTSVTPAAALADTAMLPITAFRKLVRSPLDKSPEPSWFPLTGAATSRIAAELPPQASYSNEGRREPMPAAAPAVPAAPGADKTAPKVDTTRRAPGAGGSPAAGPVNPNLDVDALTKKALETAAKAPNPFAADIESVGKEKVAAAEASAKGLKAIHDKFSDIYKGREERLNKREAEIGKMKDQNLGLALLQAGAAMMSTRGNLGTAIGAGIDTGSKQYVSGLDKLNAAKEKLSDARDRLEELNAQRGEMTAREQLKAENDIKTAGIGAREDLIKSNQQMYGVNRETALKMVDNQIKVGVAQLQEQGQDRRAAAAASRNPTLELLQAVQKDPSLAAAYQAMHGTKNDLMTQYNDYLRSNPTGTIEDFLKTKAAFSVLGGAGPRPVSALPPGASVAPR